MEEDIIRNSSWKGRKFNFDLIIKKKKNLFPYIHITQYQQFTSKFSRENQNNLFTIPAQLSGSAGTTNHAENHVFANVSHGSINR